jgi:3-phytase
VTTAAATSSGRTRSTRRLTDVTSVKAPLVFSKDTAEVQDQHTAYGLAATSIKDRPVVAVTRRSETRVGFFTLVPDGRGKVTYRQLRYVDLPAGFTLSDGTSWRRAKTRPAAAGGHGLRGGDDPAARAAVPARSVRCP